MNRVFVIVAALAVGACASAPAPEPTVATYDSDLDLAKMATIEQQARLMGVRVIWVNAPRKAAAQPTS